MRRTIATLFAAVAIVTGGHMAAAQAGEHIDLPFCQEDDVLQGIGDFDNGAWTGYRCAHPDVLYVGPKVVNFPDGSKAAKADGVQVADFEGTDPRWRPSFGDWETVPASLVGKSVDLIGSRKSAVVTDTTLWSPGGTTYFVFPHRHRIGTS